MTNLILIAASVLLAGLLVSPRILRNRLWRATATPLASIIGSGFLVSGPILAHAAGNLAWLAMIGLCGAAYLFGSAIRHNIIHVEPQLRLGRDRLVIAIDRASDLGLMFAYFISVAFYLNLFAAFAVRAGGVIDPFWIRVAASVAIIGVGAVGTLRGLEGLEWLEVVAVGVKLAVIGGLILALGVADGAALFSGVLVWPSVPAHAEGADALRIILGLVILVQGFETSRYLGAEYDARVRVGTMRRAQLISSGIYLAFILLITPYFTGQLPAKGGETEIIDMLAPVGGAVAPLIIVVALASQLSAAVADLNGAGGLLAEFLHRRLTVRAGNLATAAAAMVITWSADIYEIIAFASKAFVSYYALQSLQAGYSAWRERRFWRAGLFFAAAALAAGIIVVAEPADV